MLSRGSYGIEYDEDKNMVHRKHWWLIILGCALIVLVIAVRGCRSTHPALDDDPTQVPRFDAPETKVSRESASIGRHLFGKWFASSGSSTRTPEASGNTPPAEESLAVPKTSRRLPAPIQKLLDQAIADEQSGNLLDARLTFLHLLEQKETAELHPFFERRIGHIHSTLIFSTQPAPGKTTHTVARGDTPGKIAQRFACPQEFIMEVNSIERPENMKIGAVLQVLNNPKFELHIAKASASARLTLNGEFFKRYALASNDANTPPAGNYTVRNRNKRTLDQAEIWTGLLDDKPRRPQDICWITLAPAGGATRGGTSLQGTRNASTTDTLTIRFRNPDIDELFLLLPVGTPVVIAE